MVLLDIPVNLVHRLIEAKTTLAVLGVIVAGVYITKIAIAYSRLSHIPGPPFTGISDIPHGIATFGPAHQEWYAYCNEKYGPLARIAPNILVTTDHELWGRTSKHLDYKRSNWFYHAIRLDWKFDNVVTNTNNDAHDFRRKQMIGGYTGKENLDLEPTMNSFVRQFLELLRSKYISTDDQIIPVNFAEKVYMYNLDVISGIGLGKAFGMLKADADLNDYAKSTEEGITISARAKGLGILPMLQHPLVHSLIAPSIKDKNGFGKMMATCYQFVDERIAAGPTDKRSDMLAAWIRNGLVGDQLKSEALQAVLAGSDTTATAIRSTLLLLMSNPRVLRKLQVEVDQAVVDGVVPASSQHAIISSRQATQLPYLQAVCREGLRVLPPLTGAFARDVGPGGDEVDIDGKKVFLPEGTSIAISAVAMHRRKDVFGDDHLIFRPERWFEPDEEKLAVMTRINDLTFGAGRYQCLGKAIALQSLPKVIFELSRNFNLAVANPTKPWDVQNRLGLFMIHDFWVQVTEREPRTKQAAFHTDGTWTDDFSAVRLREPWYLHRKNGDYAL